MEIMDMGACELGREIKSGRVTAVEAAKAAIERIHSSEGKYHCYITTDEEGALERAAVDGIEMDMAEKFTQAPGLFQAVFIEGDVGRPLIPLLDIAFCFTMTC